MKFGFHAVWVRFGKRVYVLRFLSLWLLVLLSHLLFGRVFIFEEGDDIAFIFRKVIETAFYL